MEKTPDGNLGLPGIFAGMGLRSLMGYFASDKPGYVGIRRLPDTRKFELPVWRQNPKYVAPTDAKQDGYTHGTLVKLGPLCKHH